MPRISSDLEATIASLDALHQSTAARHAADREALAAMAANLDTPWGAEPEEPAPFEPPRRRRPDEPQPATPDGSWPFDEPPIADGRPGHQFSGSLRQKLLDEARAKVDW
jgi:hypothetical protein